MRFCTQDVCKTTIFYADKMVERVSREQVRIGSKWWQRWKFRKIFQKSKLHICAFWCRYLNLDDNGWNIHFHKTFPQNNNGKFRVSKSLCLAINNIDHVLQYIQPFVAVSTTLGWGQNWYTMKHIWSIYKDTFLVFFKLWTQWMLSYWQPTLLFCLAQT